MIEPAAAIVMPIRSFIVVPAALFTVKSAVW